MKTAEKLASCWLLLLRCVFLLLPSGEMIDKNSTQNQIMPICSKPDINEARNNLVGGLILGIPSVFLGSWLALGAYRQKHQDKKAIAQQASDHLHSTFLPHSSRQWLYYYFAVCPRGGVNSNSL